MTRDLSSSIIEKFNGYEIIKHELARKEKAELTPIEIVYEPIYNENVPVLCYFTDKIHLAYRSYIGRCVKGEEKVGHPNVKQCPCCEKFFAKNEKNMKKHAQVCGAKEGITYCFDNWEIISFHNNFKYLGDVPFPLKYILISKQPQVTLFVCFFDPNMFVVSYFHIYSSHPSLNLEKILIFRSFQQSAEERCCLCCVST